MARPVLKSSIAISGPSFSPHSDCFFNIVHIPVELAIAGIPKKYGLHAIEKSDINLPRWRDVALVVVPSEQIRFGWISCVRHL
jgi:hypothetical protein